MWKVSVRTLQIMSAVAVIAATCMAHDGTHEPEPFFRGFEFSQILTSIGLLISLVVYSSGLTRLWQHARGGRGITRWAAASFFAGWVSLALALIGPLHELSETLFSAHMTQHEILMLVSAPLIILGRPQIAAVWSLPARWRQKVGVFTNNPTIENAWHFISGSFAAFLIHAAVLWLWHIPTLFDATLESDTIHALQHASFFGTALLFWWAIVNSGLEWKTSFVAVLFLFLTSLHSGILGAFLTFTRQIWYPVYQDSTAAFGLTPLEDQQLGGMIMWVPAGLVYIGAALVMFARMLTQTERRSLDVDRRLLAGVLKNV